MGIKLKPENAPKRRIDQYRLQMQFNQKTGELKVKLNGAFPQFKNAPLVFMVNEKQEESMDIDKNLEGSFQFDKSVPSVLYRVKVMNAVPFKNQGKDLDQRLAFYW